MITLSLGSGSAKKGGTVSLVLSIASTGGDQCTGVQFVLGFSADVTLTSVVRGAAAGSKILNQSGAQSIIGGFDANVIPDGALLTVTFKISKHPTGNSIPILITGLVASDVNGNPLTAAGSPGTIAVLAPFNGHGGPVAGLSLNPLTGEITGTPEQAGTFTYTVQVTDSLGNVVTQDCTLTIHPALTRGMSILTAKQWATIREKGLLGLPTDIYLDQEFPNAGFHLWPIPAINYGIEFYYWAVLTSFATIASSEELPEGYYDMLVYELAIRLCQVYRRPVPPSVQAMAKNARKVVMDLNAQIIDGSFQYARTLDGPSMGEVKPKALGPPEPRLLPGAKDPGEEVTQK